MRLSAAAAGFTHAAFYNRRRTDRAFAREWLLALREGYQRLELALLEASMPESCAHDDWRHNDTPPIPPMTPDEALSLLRLHQKTVLLQQEPAHLRRRRGEPDEVHRFRLAEMAAVRKQRDFDICTIAEAGRRERGEPTPFDAPIALPDLAQVRRGPKAR